MTSTDERVRVALVDDQPLLRRSLAMIIDADPGLTVVGEAGDGVEAIEVVTATIPDVVLMDVRMPRLDGIEEPGASAGYRGSCAPGCSC